MPKQSVQFWFNAARKHALPQSLIPALLAVVFAIGTPTFSWMASIVAFVGVALLHLSINLMDDYFDFRAKGTSDRHQAVHEGFRARLGKCKYLEDGSATLADLLRVALLLLFFAGLAGTFIYFLRGPKTLVFSGIVLVLGVFYSARPIKLSYRGLGELAVGFIFGPLLMQGMYFAASGQLSLEVAFVSIPVGILVFVILFVHAILDLEPDRRVGKMTLAVKINRPGVLLIFLGLSLLLAFAIIVLGVALGYLPGRFLLVLLLLPIAVGLQKSLVHFVRSPKDIPARKWWMGAMENWDYIEQAGIDWFMVRWFLARNLLTAYCLILLLVSLVPRITGKGA